MNLEQLQRTMMAAVLQPLTADEEMQTHSSDGRPMSEVAGAFVKPNSRLTAVERLEIYNRQYWFRLQTAFGEDFPALRAVVGRERFEALMNVYLAAHPSRSFTLRNLGSKLVEWLAANPQYAGRQSALALDVAQVEWACIEAFDDAEFAPLSAEDVAGIGGESRLGLQPHVRLLELAYPADDLVLDMHQQQKREASEAGTRPEEVDAENLKPLRLRRKAIWLAIHRAELSLYYRRLSQAEYRMLVALRDGHTLAEALEAGFAGSRLSGERRVASVREWFANWSELGWITRPATALMTTEL